MEPEQRQPYRVFRAGSRSFPVCIEYDEQLDDIQKKEDPLPRRNRKELFLLLTQSSRQRPSRRLHQMRLFLV